ncbi:hypothetical protein P4O66_001963 [Electrophorus voltai]|uniref:Uncharacterized protein n=1 Tax=Electrophorus voltai TaxID=2609070 RepID=A0AAD9E608_9TELE|nr:hypothetical protein P4O66_001963 [Electrophorus voltai]
MDSNPLQEFVALSPRDSNPLQEFVALSPRDSNPLQEFVALSPRDSNPVLFYQQENRYKYRLHLILQVESNITSINGTVGQEACIQFKFESLNNSRMDGKSLIVRRDDKRTEGTWTNSSCSPSSKFLKEKSNCAVYIAETPSREVFLYFPNLCKTHIGVYQLALYVENQQMVLIESNKVNLTVYPGANVTTVITPVFVLAGLLCWFYCTYNMKTGIVCTKRQSKYTINLNKRRCPVHSTVPAVSTIEYGVLDFHKQSERTSHAEAPKVQEGVEYATILYPPQRKRT